MPPVVSAFERRARLIRRALRRYPALQPVVNRVGTFLWRWHLRRSSRGVSDEAPLAVRFDIDPCAVELALWRGDVLDLAGTTHQRNIVGLVRDGNWDEGAFDLGELGIFTAVQQRFIEGVDWMETKFFAQIADALARGERPFKFKETADLERIFGRVDALHTSIVRDGYRSQDELGTGRPWDEVVVAFDRHGRVCFVDGRHRLAIARVLALRRIPAIVAVRHASWVRTVHEIRAYAHERGGRCYQPYLHPDLADLPSEQGHSRFDMLLAALPVRSGTLVDLGANAGYFCQRFEEAGFDCIAVERSKKELHFLTVLRDASSRRFAIVPGSLTEVELPARIDVVLALNIFHHLLKTEESYRRLERFLERVRTRYMLLETHLPGDPQMAGAAHDMTPADFVEWVRARGGFSRASEIGRAEDGRPLFLLAGEGAESAGVGEDDSP